jgi:hypothetical protein
MDHTGRPVTTRDPQTRCASVPPQDRHPTARADANHRRDLQVGPCDRSRTVGVGSTTVAFGGGKQVQRDAKAALASWGGCVRLRRSDIRRAGADNTRQVAQMRTIRSEEPSIDRGSVW